MQSFPKKKVEIVRYFLQIDGYCCVIGGFVKEIKCVNQFYLALTLTQVISNQKNLLQNNKTIFF